MATELYRSKKTDKALWVLNFEYDGIDEGCEEFDKFLAGHEKWLRDQIKLVMQCKRERNKVED